MNANELMIGDYVSYKDNTVIVGAINKSDGYAIEKDMVSIKISDNYYLGINADNISPLLITSDLLKNNGFQEIKKSYDNNAVSYLLTWCENYYVSMKQAREDNWLIHIQGDYANIDGGVGYVHELQHALKLCGIEREIVL